MNELGIDYAWQHPNPAEIAKAGYRFVIRYLSTDPSKNLTSVEANQLHLAGLNVGVVWETTANAALTNNGTTDANLACGQAGSLGYPKTAVIYVNIGDWGSPNQSQVPTVVKYYGDWANQVRARGWQWGGYGPAFFLDAVYRQGLGGYLWQNGIDGPGFPGSVVYGQTSLYQRGKPTITIPGTSGGYDENVMLSNVPLWGIAVVPPPPPPPPPPPTKEIVVNVPQVSETNPGPNVVNNWVKSVQALLNVKNNAGLTTDGRFGSNTNSAVRNFQSKKGIAVDGIVGPVTADTLCNG